MDDYALAKLKGWTHREDVKDLQAFWRNVVTSKGWKKGEAYMLKTMKMWSKSLVHAIDPSIYKGKKHMEQITLVDMTVKLGRTFEDIMDSHSMLACVFKNRAEVRLNKTKDEAREVSSLTQTYEDRLRLAKSYAVAPPIDLPNFALTINTFTAEVWTYHGDRCPLYKDLLEWVEELKGGALMKEHFDFTPAYLRRALWKTMIEVDRFYGQECTPDMFERGQGPIPWPTHTQLSSLLSKFMDGDAFGNISGVK